MTLDEELAIAQAALTAIESIIKAVTDAKAGGITPKQALDALSSYQKQIADGDARADQAIKDKFGG